MNHLTVDEIINFVSSDRLDVDSVANAVRVNTHIRSCGECMSKVRAYQAVYGELFNICNKQYRRGLRMKNDSLHAAKEKKVYSLCLTEKYGR